LRLMGLELSATEAEVLRAGLAAHGYSASREGVDWLMRPTATNLGKL
jgi:hypothetical protein